jgi:hypothetical protein
MKLFYHKLSFKLNYIAVFFLLLNLGQLSAQGSNLLYDDQAVHRVDILIDADTLADIYVDIFSDRYRNATFVFNDGQHADTVQNVGFRLRGNTSRYAAKKSFRVSFNEFVPGRRYQGVKKVNLIGMHNDPTLIRQKVFYNLWNQTGQPERRLNFVRVYINNAFYGIYTNAEEMDKDWLDRVFPNDNGNLYKCTWPSDLAFINNNEQSYKNITNGQGERAYDLQTNETADDYADLLQLITTLNMAPNSTFIQLIQQQLNVEGYLKALALDVATGNWDNYAYNKNNYYLYNLNGQFQFITYDTDNTCGIDWIGIDWATRNINQWIHPNEARPLASKLLAVPQFRQRYEVLIDSITQFVTNPTVIFPMLDQLHAQIEPFRAADTYANLDWGYDYQAFIDGMTQTIDGHSPYGVKPFFQVRYNTTMGQLSDTQIFTQNDNLFQVLQNPFSGQLVLRAETALEQDVLLFDMAGQLLLKEAWPEGRIVCTIDCSALPAGLYIVRIGAQSKQVLLR